MTKRIHKYRFLLFALFSTLLFVSYSLRIYHRNWQKEVESFEQDIQQKFQDLNNFLASSQAIIERKKNSFYLDKQLSDAPFFLHVYQGDSLIYWNTNQLPIGRFADIHFPAEGMLHLQNGWYYAKVRTWGTYTICASFLIKHDYPYENEDLVNAFNPAFHFNAASSITFDQENEYKIHEKDGKFLFSLDIDKQQPISDTQGMIVLCLLLSAIGLWLLLIYKSMDKRPMMWRIIAPMLVVIMQWLSIKFGWFALFSDHPAFDASLYATSELFPNFFVYLLNCMILLFLVFSFKQLLEKMHTKGRQKWFYLLLLLPYLTWFAVHSIVKGVIENSSIPLKIENLFALNFYSLAVLSSFALLLYAYYKLTDAIVNYLFKKHPVKKLFIPILVTLSACYLIIEMWVGFGLWFSGIYPGIVIALIYLRRSKNESRRQLAFGLFFIGLAAAITTLNLAAFNERKEHSERELFASQLASEEDILTEIEYASIVTKLENDRMLQRFINQPENVRIAELEEALESRIFKGFWEKYELGFSVLDSNEQTLFTGLENVEVQSSNLKEIVEEHGRLSEIDKRIAYIADHYGQYSYIIKQPLLRKDGLPIDLFITLKSKRIPEEIGYPRLLISSESQVLSSLENYSIARYYKKKLIVEYGEFNFPTSLHTIKTWRRTDERFFTAENYSHYVLSRSTEDVVILSTKVYSWQDGLTSFSYLFCFFGLLFIPSLLRFEVKPLFKQSLSLGVKIQFMLIALVFLTLLAFSIGSGAFVSKQYNSTKNEEIRAKLSSIEMEMKTKIGHYKQLDIELQGNYLSAMLQKLSKVFKTDINLFDYNGFLVASSRPKVFNMGLLSEQMNIHALNTLKFDQKSAFIQREEIGKLGYSSAYQPIFNKGGKLLGYINLQQFGQQQEFIKQIQNYLEAIINVFMLLLAISVVLALFISNWVTGPLKQLHESLTSIKFGTYNQQITYDKEDEIGVLVKDYNRKLEELETTALQLAKSERESAWREMAKQVAHEIKNPLTPMKLSVQQLLRVYNPNDPESHKKLEKVAQSIIEQIDGLTKIANEFSNFAKMPLPEFNRIDLLPLIDTVVEVFRQDFSHEIKVITASQNAHVHADKEQMIRVLNNLLKNAIQSVPDDRKGIINVTVKTTENKVELQIQDNGKGILPTERNKIFVPYFTTKSTGTGLGLAMVKQIVENHRGTIEFVSTENVGTTFTIELPLA